MDINITGKNISLSDKFKSILSEKVESLEKFHKNIQFIDVLVEKFPDHHHEINLKIGIPGTQTLVISQSDVSLQNCIDALKHKAEAVLTSKKEKTSKIKKTKPVDL